MLESGYTVLRNSTMILTQVLGLALRDPVVCTSPLVCLAADHMLAALALVYHP